MLQRPTPEPTVDLFGIRIDAVSLDQAVERLSQWIEQPDGQCHYVVTPNVDHLVQLRGNSAFQATYRDAALVVADGLPLVLASRWFGKPLPERVAGSDLVPALFDTAVSTRPLRVFLLGAAPGVAERAAQRMAQRWPHVHVSGLDSPPLGFQHDANQNARIVQMIRQAAPDLLVVGLGAPKQELWVHQHQNQIAAPVALCAGATIDFLAGERHRAPRWIQKCGLEWCHRMLSDPRRLVRRYAHDACVFPQLLWQQWRQE